MNPYSELASSKCLRELALLIGGDAYTAPVAAVNQSGTTTYYYLLRDYLGNITHQVSTSNTVVAEYNFDTWGRRRSADDWSYTMDGNDLALFADRGFTGHETLSWFNLVNMNGRLYDPLVGRFLSADPYVQADGQTQAYNRYSYCLNNPLRYVDYNGYTWWSHLKHWLGKEAKKAVNVAVNIVVDAVAIGIGIPVASLVTAATTVVGLGQLAITGNSTILKNEGKIIGGLLTGSPKQILSRFTKELPQTVVGYIASQGSNMVGDVKDVSYFHGATVVEHYSNMQGSFTIGPYINLGHSSAYYRDGKGNEVRYNNYENPNVLHEYGHYLQSQAVGPTYLFNYALPSLINSIAVPDQMTHNAFWVEQDADIRGRNYFGDSNWDYRQYFILGDPKNPYGTKYDNYNNYMGPSWFEKMYKWLNTATN